MGSMSIMHWAIVVGVVALLFGKGKISGLMTDAAQGIKAFKKGMAEEQPNMAKEPRKQLTENAVVSTSE